jgi:hypothetical protein
MVPRLVTLKRHGPTQANAGSKDRVLVYRINQLLLVVLGIWEMVHPVEVRYWQKTEP